MGVLGHVNKIENTLSYYLFQNIERRKQKPHLFGYDALEENMDEDSSEPKILSKYDEEIDGERKSSFVLGKFVIQVINLAQSDKQFLYHSIKIPDVP